MASKKEQVIEELYKICKHKNDYTFHNDIVKDVCKKVGFGNPFDVTKLDSKESKITCNVDKKCLSDYSHRKWQT